MDWDKNAVVCAGKVKLRSPTRSKKTRLRNALLYQCLFGISFAEIATASFKKVKEMLCLGVIEEITDEEEFVQTALRSIEAE